MLGAAWRGKFSPGDRSGTRLLDKEERRIIPVPITGNNNVTAPNNTLYDIVEGFSRPVSPTTHLHHVFVPQPPTIRKRKSISKRFLESFREIQSESVTKEELLSKYVKNKLSEDLNVNSFTNNKIFSTGKVERVASKLSRKNSEIKSFLMNSFRTSLDSRGRTKNLAPNKQSSATFRTPVHCKYHSAGCSLRFSHARPQLRLQHEATCRYMTTTCYWAGGTCAGRHVSLLDIEDHLLEHHGHLVTQVEQEGEMAIRLGDVIPMLHGETSWPDNLGCCGPQVIIISALGYKFMLFIKDSEKMQENYDLSVAALGPPQMASKFSYELRLFDEVGFAYRGPMLSAATPTNQFWTQGYHLHIPNLDVLGSFFETTVRIFYRG